jgi:predicted transposase/invertase (TIGR01784 family)
MKSAREIAIIKNRLDRGQAELNAKRKGHAEGLAEGHAEGLAKGLAESKLEIARNLKKMGLPVSQIAEGTGLSSEAIQKL